MLCFVPVKADMILHLTLNSIRHQFQFDFHFHFHIHFHSPWIRTVLSRASNLTLLDMSSLKYLCLSDAYAGANAGGYAMATRVPYLDVKCRCRRLPAFPSSTKYQVPSPSPSPNNDPKTWEDSGSRGTWESGGSDEVSRLRNVRPALESPFAPMKATNDASLRRLSRTPRTDIPA